ncbi:hypothetical protein PTKIN_Ptkin09bG0283100 [Pterospermum kingtungense]
MTLNFHTNKKIIKEVAIIPSKGLRNKIVGFSTHLMKQMQKRIVCGISLKFQEEERERRTDFVPNKSAIKVDQIEVDEETHLIKVDPVFVMATKIRFACGGGLGRRF